jgi:hypothetical protein
MPFETWLEVLWGHGADISGDRGMLSVGIQVFGLR